MSDKDEIKELFQKELGNYQAKVNPNLWKSVQAGIGSSAAATATTMGILTKTIIGGGIAAVIAVTTVLLNNNHEENQPKNELNNVKTETVSPEKTTIKNEKTTEEKTPLKQENKTVQKEEENKQEKTTADKVEEKENLTILLSEQKTEKESEIVQKTVENTTDIVPKTTPVENDFSQKTTFPEEQEQQPAIDLSKVNIQVKQNNNQFFLFSIVDVPENGQITEITWDFGDGNYGHQLSNEHFYIEPGIYEVKLRAVINQQKITKTTEVEVQVKGEIGELPNVFTPNGDGKNDVFYIHSKGLKTFQLTVMDQHQNTVFSTNNPDFKWNGIDKMGNMVKSGTYIYIIVAEDEAGNTINKYQQLIIQK